MALRNLELKQERIERCYVVGKDPPIAAFGFAHQKRVERRHMNCVSCAQQIGKIKIDLLLSENKLPEHLITALSQDCR